MNSDRDLAGPAEFAWAARARTDGVRRVRRMSNLTAAALIAGTGAATVALAHQVFPVSAGTATSGNAATGTGTTATGNGPKVSHSVATSTGSSVPGTTTKQAATGNVGVTPVQRAVPYRDN